MDTIDTILPSRKRIAVRLLYTNENGLPFPFSDFPEEIDPPEPGARF